MPENDFEARLRRLEDIETARGIFHTYAHTLDEPHAGAVAALFTEDGILRVPGAEVAGRRAIEDFYETALAAEPSLKRHFIVNARVADTTPGRVRFESYFFYVGRGDARSVI